MFDNFGKSDPHNIPGHLFSGVRHLDYSTAIRADISQQNFSVCPRHWYIDAAFCCSRCGQGFVFRADEQKFWYEALKFWIDSIPRQCAKCRNELRHLKALQREYNRELKFSMRKNATIDQKERLVKIIKAIETGGVMLTAKAIENRRILSSRIEKSRQSGAE